MLDTVLGVLLPLGAGAAAYALHAPAFSEFAAQWQAISDSGVSGDDFTAPLTFWLFFAVMHPLLQPAIAARALPAMPARPTLSALTARSTVELDAGDSSSGLPPLQGLWTPRLLNPEAPRASVLSKYGTNKFGMGELAVRMNARPVLSGAGF